jgi:carbon dioxide concentrating mechanism protein CcmN
MTEPMQAAYSSRGHIQGDVAIAPGVALADGALLGAAPGCRLVISAGVCLGADVVIQASQGELVIEPGASLGSGVVVVGQGRIGQQACIGADSTLINPAIAPTQVVPPKSLLGDPSQPPGPLPSSSNGSLPTQIMGSPDLGLGSQAIANQDSNGHAPPASPMGTATHAPETQAADPPATASQETSAADPEQSEFNPEAAPEATNGQAPPGSEAKLGTYIYGQSQVNRLLDTLFPHRRPLNGPTSEDKP